MECLSGTIGLVVLAGTTVMACGVALTLAILPRFQERRRSVERAAFLRAQLLHQLDILPSFLQERDRALTIEQRDILDAFCCLAQQASLLDIDEWDSVLRVDALMMTARNRPSLSKREARLAQQAVHHAKAVLQRHDSEAVRQDLSWTRIFAGHRRRKTVRKSSPTRSFNLRETIGS
jgi:hypothetical protein